MGEDQDDGLNCDQLVLRLVFFWMRDKETTIEEVQGKVTTVLDNEQLLADLIIRYNNHDDNDDDIQCNN